ncbi:hypothetical protein LACJE0001_1215 [Lactobacillus jensenii 269-3]|nr:hypothetical protein LACJE0001_1215 [Lactobacillus jensenii 269-3]
MRMKVVQYSTENYPLTYLNGLLANLQEGHFNGRKRTLRKNQAAR